MVNQLSKTTDKKLNNFSRLIGAAEELIQRGTAKKDAVWEDVFSFMAEHNQTRFLADDGYFLAQQVRQGAPKLDEEHLFELLKEKHGTMGAQFIWGRITVSKVDTSKLEAAVKMGYIKPALVDQCITVADPTYARVRRLWTKDDMETAVNLSISIDPVAPQVVKNLMEEIINEKAN